MNIVWADYVGLISSFIGGKSLKWGIWRVCFRVNWEKEVVNFFKETTLG